MTISFEDITAAHKANVDTFLDLSTKAFAGAEKLFALNLQTAMSQPVADKAMSYGRHLADLTTAAQAELSKIAETQFADVQQELGVMVDAAPARICR